MQVFIEDQRPGGVDCGIDILDDTVMPGNLVLTWEHRTLLIDPETKVMFEGWSLTPSDAKKLGEALIARAEEMTR